MVLGQGAYSEGLDSSTLLANYKGVGILRGASDASPTVRTYLADAADAERILTIARGIRARAGTLSGRRLARPTTSRRSRSPLTCWPSWPTSGRCTGEPLAALLRARFPDRHADATAESVSAQCRAAGIPSVQVKYLGANRQGCRRADVEAATPR
jgi:DNA segregation ATPase FtsK/SpoIIIE, S-DNA-T family